MGHIRLGVLPKYPRWKAVIALLTDPDVPAANVADRVLDGTKGMLLSEAAQGSVGYCVWFLAQLTLAASGDQFRSEIAELGIEVTDQSSATEFLATTSRIATLHLSTLTPRNALNNIAGLALREVLTSTVGLYARTLFGADLPDVQRALRRYSTRKQFGKLLHTYFAVFLRRTLRFIIDKEIANHVGPGKRFQDLDAVEEFEDSLEVFASQTSRMIDEFSGGWYSKRVWQHGNISESDASRFAHIALKKLHADLELNQDQ
jgi:hypothetical protein